MQKAAIGARLLLGLLFLVFGLNGFFNFLPQPEMPEAAGALAMAFAKAGYMWPLIKATEVISGALLLAGFFVPLALLFLAPVVLNILLFHIFLEQGNYGIPVVVLILGLFVAYSRREAYARVLSAK